MKQAESSRATIKDVAHDAGVSIKTVSRVINKEGSIRAATREKVEASIKKLRYIPNMAARGLAGSHSFKLALIYDHTPDHANFHYIIHVQSGMLDCCRREGYDLLIHPCDLQAKNLAADIAEMAKVSRVSGIILVPPLADNRKLTGHLEKSGIPFVTITSIHKPRSVANLICNDAEASCAMIQHLIGLGHRRLAIIKGHPKHGAAQIRFAGFMRAMTGAGLEVPDAYVVQGYFDFESGRVAAAKLLALKQPPTAIFASNDEMAAGVVHQALKQNLAVPGRLSVAGFDDGIIATKTFPTLTTVRQPVREMAGQAAQLLVEASRNGKRGESAGARLIRFEHEIVIRNSTGKPE